MRTKKRILFHGKIKTDEKRILRESALKELYFVLAATMPKTLIDRYKHAVTF